MNTLLKGLTLFVLAMSIACAAPEPSLQDESVPGASQWHFSGFEQVRAYHVSPSYSGIVDRDGQLNPDRRPKDGVLLNVSQLQTLEAAVTGSHPPHDFSFCDFPHHAFVFFDPQGGIVGYIDICFSCSTYSGSPDGFVKPWDLEALRGLFDEMGIPVEENT